MQDIIAIMDKYIISESEEENSAKNSLEKLERKLVTKIPSSLSIQRIF